MPQRLEHSRDGAAAIEPRRVVVGKVGFIGPLIRPTGTFSPRGEEGIETLRHIPSPLRWRQPDEGLFSGRQQDRWPIAARCRR
ncbi:hypothetical protein ELH68_00725 [Rhizobium ruizarguesonis]|nr:hypothetical protein ELH68_00725 [Rhizobium ruizarguesonis]TBA03035.1 hypothetical protein ELH64_00725 [Rhizobium ruizarguesonis]TBC33727.1 hypothetical protein ELH33_00720 [Rhizobium ruizarguesonis]